MMKTLLLILVLPLSFMCTHAASNILDDYGESRTDLTNQISVLGAVRDWKINTTTSSNKGFKKKIGYSSGQKLWGLSFDGSVWKYNDRDEYQFVFSKEIIKVSRANKYETFCKSIPRRLRENYSARVGVSDIARYDSVFTTYLDADVRSGVNYIKVQCTFYKVANNKVSGSIFISITIDDDFVGVQAPTLLTCDQAVQMVKHGKVGPVIDKPDFRLAIDPNREAVLSPFNTGEILKFGPKYILSEKKEHRRGEHAIKFTFSFDTYEYLLEAEVIGESTELTVLGKCR